MARIRKKLANIEGINIADTIGSIRHQLHEDSTISPTLRATIELLILIVRLLCNRLGLNGDNSSKPPSSDSFAKAPVGKPVGKKGSRKPGGQPGHQGHQLEPVEDPDHLDLGADDHIRQKILDAPVVHADETGINIAGQRHWLHCASTAQWTQYNAHQKRGNEAMLAVAILPLYQGILCHERFHLPIIWRNAMCAWSSCSRKYRVVFDQ